MADGECIYKPCDIVHDCRPPQYSSMMKHSIMQYYTFKEFDQQYEGGHQCARKNSYTSKPLIKELLPPRTVTSSMKEEIFKKSNTRLIPNLGSEDVITIINEGTTLKSDELIGYANDGNTEYVVRHPSETQRMDWLTYHRLAVIHKFLDDLEMEFPSLCTTGIIGKSLEGRDLKVLKISNSDATNAAVWVDAGIHAREWIGPAVNTYLANFIARNFHSLPESVTSKDWYFLPVINPDGYEYTHTNDRMWRKNRAWCSGQCVGVDLNRNFSFGWGGKGSSNIPTHCFYRGPEPFSEPESCAIRDFLLNSDIDFAVYITLHSYGEVIIFPYASKDHLCPDYIRLLRGATVMSKAIYQTNGNIYKVGLSKDVMYRASGTSNDWSYGYAGIPYCYLIELRSKKHKFKLPQEEIEETGKEIVNCVLALVEFVAEQTPAKEKSALSIHKETSN